MGLARAKVKHGIEIYLLWWRLLLSCGSALLDLHHWNYVVLHVVIVIVDCTLALIYEHALVAFKWNWLKETCPFIVPLLLEELKVLACSLLDFDVGMIFVSLDDVLDT